jgi:hypothetical protein
LRVRGAAGEQGDTQAQSEGNCVCHERSWWGACGFKPSIRRLSIKRAKRGQTGSKL